MISVVFAVGSVLNSVDSTIVNTALPTIADDFGASAAQVSAVTTAYLVALAIMIPAAGWLGDRFGYRRTFLGALALFLISSAMCGVATSLDQLIGARVLQGMSGGILTPIGMALLYRVYPPPERIRIARLLALPIALGPASGPVLGGLFVDHLSWRWAFLINIPIGLGTLVYGLMALDAHRDDRPTRLDGWGFLLMALGMGLFMAALTHGASSGWTDPAVGVSAFAGLGALALFTARSLRIRRPILNLRLLSDRVLRTTTGFTAFSSAGLISMLFLVPAVHQAAHGRSATHTGLMMLPQGVGLVLGAQVIPHLYHRLGPRRMVIGGACAVTATTVVLMLQSAAASVVTVGATMFVLGVSTAFVFLPVSTLAFVNVKGADTGHAASIFHSVRQVGGALGVAAVATAISVVDTTSRSAVSGDPRAYRAGFAIAVVFGIGSVLVALRVRDADAVSTMAGGETLP